MATIMKLTENESNLKTANTENEKKFRTTIKKLTENEEELNTTNKRLDMENKK